MAEATRNICIITGTRADYGLLKPVMQAVASHMSLNLQLIATGMHLDARFGSSVELIRKDGFVVNEEVEMSPTGDTGKDMALAMGPCVSGMTEALDRLQPDIVLVLGDRIEIMAGVLAAAYMNIPIAHIHGGDVTRGGIDESVRHSITKFAHIHFPATQSSADRILKMGEDAERIHLTGAPCLDTILNQTLLGVKEVSDKIGLDFTQPVVVLLQHSVTTEIEAAGTQFSASIEALQEIGLPTLIIYPNSDAGGQQIIREIEKLENDPQFTSVKNLPHIEYLSVLKHAAVLLGNSSSGIIESSSFHLPVVNLGIRQEGRERAGNVINAKHRTTSIIQAMNLALSTPFQEVVKHCINPYGDGKTGIKIANILAEIELGKALLQKRLSY